MELAASFQVALALLLPAGVVALERRSRLVATLSPVIICYALGMVLGNQSLVPFSNRLALTVCNVTVAFAIPLLLFSVDIGAWLRLARATVLSFVLAMAAAVAGVAAAHLLLGGRLADTPRLGGMLTGVYIGGTPNMAAIGTAMGVPAESFILLNAADMIVSFGYLLFILALAPRLLRRFLPAFPAPAGGPAAQEPAPWRLPPWRDALGAVLLAAAAVGASVGIGALVPAGARDAVIILGITTLAVAASTRRRVRGLRGSQEMGQFLLLVFCVAIGYTTDFSRLFSASPLILIFAAVTVGITVAVHFALAALFRIDVDTAIITSTAGIFGPHMVGPVAVALKNREVLFSGIASGLVGYAAANYLGLAVAWMLS